MHTKVSNLLTNGKTILLAYDHGLEHGPKDFNLKNVDPEHVFNIALEAELNGIIVQPGVAEKYHKGRYADIPLVVKLNGKDSIVEEEPYSPKTCSVSRAIELGAEGVGYTLYLGSGREHEMIKEFSEVVEKAHQQRVPVIAWIYPRGEYVENELNPDLLEYGARIGLELGADMVKMKYHGDKDHLNWMTKCAGRTKLLMAGGEKRGIKDFFRTAREVMNAGASGLAVGRNVWQSEKPFSVAKTLKSIVF